MRYILALLACLFASAASAQNVTCSTRPIGDNSNACASTAFVQSTTVRPPSLTQRGSVYAFNGVTSQWPWQLNTDGTWTLRQPAASDVIFTASGASAVARTSQDKSRERISVADYGASCSASAAANQAAVQAVFDQNPTAKILFTGNCNYNLQKELVLTDLTHSFSGQVEFTGSTSVTFTSGGNASDADSAMVAGFRMYTKNATQEQGGPVGVKFINPNITGPAHGASIYAANGQSFDIIGGAILGVNGGIVPRYGIVLENMIRVKIERAIISEFKNAGVGILYTGNPHVISAGAPATINNAFNDSITISHNVMGGNQTSSIACILDHGSNSFPNRIIDNNACEGMPGMGSVQYFYVTRAGAPALRKNWTENIPYPVRFLTSTDTGSLTGVTGAEPSGTYAGSLFPGAWSYTATLEDNETNSSVISFDVSGVNNPVLMNGNRAQNLTDTMIKSTGVGANVVIDSGNTLIGGGTRTFVSNSRMIGFGYGGIGIGKASTTSAIDILKDTYLSGALFNADVYYNNSFKTSFVITSDGATLKITNYQAFPLCIGVSNTCKFTLSSAGVATFSDPPIIPLTGYVKGNGASALTASATVPTTDLSGTLQAAQFPALTGAVTTSAGSLSTSYNTVVPSNKGGAGSITGALKADGAGNVSQAAASDLSNGTTGSGSVVLATNPQLGHVGIGRAADVSTPLHISNADGSGYAFVADIYSTAPAFVAAAQLYTDGTTVKFNIYQNKAFCFGNNFGCQLTIDTSQNTTASGTLKGAALLSTAAAPTASLCGTSPTVDSGSSRNAGKFTIGSGSTTCTLSFATAFPTNAYCTVTPAAQPAAVANIPYISAQTNALFTISGGTASTTYYYTCGGN